MGVLALMGWQNTWGIMLPYYLFMLAHGVHQPCGQSGAVSPFPQAAGAASALSGFTMMVAAFAMGTWLGGRMSSAEAATVLPLTNGIWFWSVMIALVAWTLVQRFGDARTAPQRVAAGARP
jgi:DHA1 family bicyclomycin/chloramphenicol resistance-like MFS transporter